jgi:DNA polymerase V
MIALIDCNNFYCSCERTFNPSLNNKPLIVLSNNDGCAIARSEEAKAIGIKMGTPHFMITDILEEKGVQVQSSNYTLYGDMSSRVIQIIKEFVPVTEIYSIDELFADLSGFKYKSLTILGKELREAVISCTGVPVTVGIAPTKTLAKMANRFAKKKMSEAGVFSANNKHLIDEMLQFTKVGDIWGIGKQHESFLNKNGFFTAADLVNAPEEWIRKKMSVVGQRTLNELKGIPCIKWEETPAARKNICTSRSFGQLISSKTEICQAVAKFTASCGEKLRRENSCARKIHVFIQTNPHRNMDQQYFQSVTMQLSVPTNSTNELMRYSMSGLNMIFRPGYNYQKAGVMMLDLICASEIQLGLFDKQDRRRDKQIMKTLDEVNRSFGKDVVRYGVHAYGNKWKLRQNNLSPCYTTRLDQLPKAM